MPIIVRRLHALLVAACCSSCASPEPTAPPAPVTVEVGEAFDLAPQAEARIDGADISLQLASLRDYRCPVTLLCLSGVDVDVTLRLRRGGEESLLTIPQIQRRPTATALGVTVQTISVAPVREEGAPPRLSRYRIRLVVLSI